MANACLDTRNRAERLYTLLATCSCPLVVHPIHNRQMRIFPRWSFHLFRPILQGRSRYVPAQNMAAFIWRAKRHTCPRNIQYLGVAKNRQRLRLDRSNRSDSRAKVFEQPMMLSIFSKTFVDPQILYLKLAYVSWNVAFTSAPQYFSFLTRYRNLLARMSTAVGQRRARLGPQSAFCKLKV